MPVRICRLQITGEVPTVTDVVLTLGPAILRCRAGVSFLAPASVFFLVEMHSTSSSLGAASVEKGVKGTAAVALKADFQSFKKLPY